MHDLAPLKLTAPAVPDWSAARLPGRARTGFEAAHLKASRATDPAAAGGMGLPDPLRLAMIGAVEALSIGPGEWLLVAPGQQASELTALLKATDEAGIISVRCESRIQMLDMSVSADVIGSQAGLPSSALVPGRVIRTRLADIAIIIAVAADGAIRIIFDRTFAPHVRAWLDRAI